MKPVRAAACLALAWLSPTAASAQIAPCLLVTTQDGELTLGADLMGWRTGRPAVVDASTSVPVTLFVNTPTGWAIQPARTPSTRFSVSAQLSGANGGQLAPGGGGVSGALAATGTTHVAVSMAGSAASPFPSGLYSADVTVTCAPR